MTPRLVYFPSINQDMHIGIYIPDSMCMYVCLSSELLLCALCVLVVCQDLRHNAGSVGDRQVKWVCVCVCSCV